MLVIVQLEGKVFDGVTFVRNEAHAAFQCRGGRGLGGTLGLTEHKSRWGSR